VPEAPPERAIFDTSALIDLAELDADALPREVAISAITLAELAAGPHATDDLAERARRQEHLQRVESLFETVSVDGAVARAYGRVYAAVVAQGRTATRRRAFDLLIAATALAHGVPLYTRNPHDFTGLEEIVDVVGVL
jgi:predicted nucleic acid-binding protein